MTDMKTAAQDEASFAEAVAKLSDRELLEAVCGQLRWLTLNALTPETLVSAAEEKLPELLTKFEGNPLFKTIMKFL